VIVAVDDDVKKLIDRSTDDDFSAADHDQLQAALRSSREVRRYYYEHMATTAMVAFEANAREIEVERRVVSPTPAAPSPLPLRILSIAAAVLVIMGLAYRLGHERGQIRVADTDRLPAVEYDVAVAFGTMLDASWDVEGTEPATGMTAGDVTYVLTTGLVQLHGRGVELVIEAPAEFRLRYDRVVELTHGRLLARVNEDGHGFIVSTPFVEVLDLGTVFGVNVSSGGETAVHVYSGSTKVQPPGTGDGASADVPGPVLNGGEACRFTSTESLSDHVVLGASLATFADLFPLAGGILDDVQGWQEWHEPMTNPVFGELIGEWRPHQLSRQPKVFEWDVTRAINGAAVYDVVLPHVRGNYVDVHWVELVQGGRVLARDEHLGTVRKADGKNTFRLWPDEPVAKENVQVRMSMQADNVPAFSGQIWMKGVNPASPTLQRESFAAAGNIAEGRPVIATSQERDKDAVDIVDGRINHSYHGWWASPVPQHITVDLGKVEQIDRIQAFTLWDNSRYYQYRIDVSSTGKTWRSVVDMSANVMASLYTGDSHKFDAVGARYVRFTFLYNSANDAGHLVELRVFPAD
jgi:hypothetical protein